MKCQNCNKEHDGSYGSGRFCSSHCARSFATSKNRKEINKKVSETMLKKCKHVKYKGKTIPLKKYNQLKNKHDNYIERRSKLAREINLSESPYNEFDTAYKNAGEYKDCFYLTKHNKNNKIVKRAIVPYYRYDIEFELQRRLKSNEIVHHIDGNHFNNKRENLIVLSSKEHCRLHKNLITIEEILKEELYVHK